jgi:hypothetical protein
MNTEQKQQLKKILGAFAYRLTLDVEYRKGINRAMVWLPAPANRDQLETFNEWLATKPIFDFKLV